MDEDDLSLALVPRDRDDIPLTAEDEIGTEIAFGRPVDAVASVLAERWGVSTALVAKRVNRFMSERAARVMSRMRTNIPEIYAEHRDRLSMVFRTAMEKKTEGGKPRPDLSNALKAAVALAQLDGFLTPRQMEMTAGLRAQQLPTIDDVEFMRQVEEVMRVHQSQEPRVIDVTADPSEEG